MPSQLVPDIDTTTAQRCMSENPLKICHTPANKVRKEKKLHNLSQCTHLEGVNYNQSFLFVQQRLGRGLAGRSSDQESGEETGKVSLLDNCKAKAEDVCIESIHDLSVDIAKDDNSTKESRKVTGTSDEGVEATSSCTHSHQSGISAGVLLGNSNRTDEQLTELESGKVVSAELITTAKTEALSLPRNQQGYDTKEGEELQENRLSPPREGVVRYTSVGVQTELTPNLPAINGSHQKSGNDCNFKSGDATVSVAPDTEPATFPSHLQGNEEITQGQGEETEPAIVQQENEAMFQNQGYETEPVAHLPHHQQKDEPIFQSREEEIDLATALPEEQVMSESVEEGDNFSLLTCASIGLQTEPTTPARLHTEPPPTIRPSLMLTVFPPASGPLTASVATQCSCPVIPSLLSLKEKSTQTLSATHKDTGMQTVEDDIKSSDGASSIVGYTGEQPAAVSGEVSALQQELESMQNTVIWQALMLKLYTMQ